MVFLKFSKSWLRFSYWATQIYNNFIFTNSIMLHQLIWTILILSCVFTYSMIKEAFVMCLLGLLVVVIHLLSFTATMLISPGIPSTEVSEEDITAVIESKKTWWEKCKGKLQSNILQWWWRNIPNIERIESDAFRTLITIVHGLANA